MYICVSVSTFVYSSVQYLSVCSSVCMCVCMCVCVCVYVVVCESVCTCMCVSLGVKVSLCSSIWKDTRVVNYLGHIISSYVIFVLQRCLGLSTENVFYKGQDDHYFGSQRITTFQ